jgi:hypothetical protein
MIERGGRWLLLFLSFPVLLMIAAVALLLFLIATVCLHITIWTWWCLRGRDILFVYSDSPIWHDTSKKASFRCSKWKMSSSGSSESKGMSRRRERVTMVG